MSEIVQCPKCHSAVSVGAGQAGQRVQCPSCLKQFLAPSSLSGSGASAEDEDWLSLDEPSVTKPAESAEVTPSTTQTPPVKSDGDSDNALDFGDDPFEVSPTDVFTDPQSDPTDLFADLPSLSGAAVPTPSDAPNPNVAQTIGADEEFRVKCPVCGSVMYAKARQTGKTIKCNDCYTEVRVPKPPRKTEKPQPSAASAMFDLADTGTAGRPSDPFKKNADELLREAEREPDEEIKPAFDAPSAMVWVKSVFGIFLDPGVIIHFLGLSSVFGIAAAFITAMAEDIPILALGGIPVAMVAITLSVACGFAILFGVANGHDRIEDWPTVDPTGWFESLALVITATAIAVGPAYVLGKAMGGSPELVIALVMFSVYALFPFILLSMLDMQSFVTPFSADVGKSITRCQEDWGAFYFSSGLLFVALFGFFLMTPPTPGIIAAGVALSVAVVFMYFAMLGRLAVAIGDVVGLDALDKVSNEDEEETREA